MPDVSAERGRLSLRACRSIRHRSDEAVSVRPEAPSPARTARERFIGAALTGFERTGLHRGLAPLTRGGGAILAFHHVRPDAPAAFAPNRGLEITPAHLDAVLGRLRETGYRIVPLDEIPACLGERGRVVALTFDDGYRDNLLHALPVLERHDAPFTLFVTPGFADRTARLWWLELEQVLARSGHLSLTVAGRRVDLPAGMPAQKQRAFATLARALRHAPPPAVAEALDRLGCALAEGRTLVGDLCLDWEEIARLAAHPLATIGCHTLSHPCLAALDPASMRHEMAAARDAIAARIGHPVRHLAYPYGGAGAAGRREFTAAADLGFATAVTTRPGVLQAADARRLTALPRLSVNGLWPRLGVLDILLSGAPFWLRGRLP